MKHKHILLLFPLLLSLSSCENDTPVFQEYLYLFDTFVDMRLYEGNKEQKDHLVSLLKELDALLDPYQSYQGVNNLHAINESQERMEVSPYLSEFLTLSLQAKEETNGYIDPLIGSLSSLWKSDLEKGVIPSQEEIDYLLQEKENSSLSIEGNYVQRSGSATLDSGALAKGYALKKVKEYLEEQKINRYLFSLGGSSILLGEKTSQNKDFKVSIRELGDQLYFQLHSTSLGTSSIYQQKYEIDGKIYSHIINPMNGKAEVKSPLVVVSGLDPFTMDCYSTYFALCGQEVMTTMEEKCDALFYDGKEITYCSESLEVYQR